MNFFSQTLRVTHTNMSKTPILPPILHLKQAQNRTQMSQPSSRMDLRMPVWGSLKLFPPFLSPRVPPVGGGEARGSMRARRDIAPELPKLETNKKN